MQSLKAISENLEGDIEDNIESDSEMEYPLLDNWVLWFHKVDDDKWDISSYQELYTLTDLEDFHAMFNTFFNHDEKMTANAAMFFLMREGIKPMWEDPKNRKGGMWCYKVPKKEDNKLKSDVVWKKLTAACIGGVLTKNRDDMKYINGVSISPKLDNCIFKIWNNDTSKNNPKLIIEDIDGIDSDKTIYKKFVK